MATLRLLQFTDTHLFSDPQGVVRGTRTLPSLRACLDHALRRHLPADAIAVTGDLVQDDPEAYGVLELVFSGLAAPVLLIPGNHDDAAEMTRRFAQPEFQVCGTRVMGPWAVVLLDTTFEVSGRGEGRLGPARLQALDSELARLRESHILICLHHPPVPMETAGLDSLGLRDASAFLEVIGRHANVRGVAWGHAHQSLDVFRGPVRLMCTPATCMQFKPRDPGFVVDDRPPGYRVIDLHDDGGIASEVVWLEGYGR
jgi:Icc protein